MRFAPHCLALALLLLWPPTALFLGRRRRRELRSSDSDPHVGLPTLLTSIWSWVDLVRAGLGAWLLIYFVQLPDLLAAFHLQLPPNQPVPRAYPVGWVAFQLGALLLGVWAQVMLTGSRRLRLAPLLYLLGITVALLPWKIFVFGGLLGLTLTGMLGRWRAVFWIMPVTLAAAAALFRILGILSAFVPVLYAVPALLGVRPGYGLAWVIARNRMQNTPVDRASEHRRARGKPAPTPRTP